MARNGQRALAGVNLGGWLVLEKWMTPSLFEGTDAVDEFTFCQRMTARQRKQLRQFRNKFITLKDFEWLAERGIEAVRIPVGYWVFGDKSDDAPFEPTIEYLDKAFEWAKATGLQVLISLHGAPGSQNGQDHSGRVGSIDWHTDQANVDQTIAVARQLAERYKSSKQLLGISMLNEPTHQIKPRILRRYYRQAYKELREEHGRRPWVVFSDGFRPQRWRWTLRWPFHRGVLMDTHQYRIFTETDKEMSAERHLLETVSMLPRVIRAMRRHHRIIVGEWSAALDDRSFKGKSLEERQGIYRAYTLAQMRVYDQTDAWFYWSYKIEGGGPWSFRDAYDKGWFEADKGDAGLSTSAL